MDFDNNIPIYVQLVNEIKLYIISGKLKPGDRLLSVRDFASIFKVNPNTMQKALTELEELKLIYTERTNGKFVTNNIMLINNIKKEYAKNIIDKYFIDMKNIGIDEVDAIKYIIDKENVNEINRV